MNVTKNLKFELETQVHESNDLGSTSSTCTGICGNKHDAYSRRCVVCNVVFCRDCKKRGMTKLSHRTWRCLKHGGHSPTTSPDKNVSDRKKQFLSSATTSTLHSSSTLCVRAWDSLSSVIEIFFFYQRNRIPTGTTMLGLFRERVGSASNRGSQGSRDSKSPPRSPKLLGSPKLGIGRSNTLQFF